MLILISAYSTALISHFGREDTGNPFPLFQKEVESYNIFFWIQKNHFHTKSVHVSEKWYNYRIKLYVL